MTIRYKVLNHNKTIRDLTFDTGTNDTGCSCEDSPFLNTDVGHIATGDLTIVKDRKLRKLLQKGPSYRKPTKINWGKTLHINTVREFNLKQNGPKERN